MHAAPYIERDIGLKVVGIDEFGQVNAGDPVRRHGELVGGLPFGLDEASLCIDATGIAAHQELTRLVPVSLGMANQLRLRGLQSSTKAAIPAKSVDCVRIGSTF